jgi:hypothetical protein
MIKHKLLLIILIFLISCSSNKIVIEASDLINNKFNKYYLITKENESIEFRKFSINNDTLVIIQSKQLLFNPEPLKIPFNNIEKIYVINYPNKTIGTTIFFGSIVFGFLMLIQFYMNL